MSETTTETTAAAETSGDSTATEATATETSTTTETGETALGDAGKQALDRMKAERREAREAAAAEKARADALQAKLDGKEAEFTAAQEAQRVKDEAISAANDRILKAEVRAAAAGKLADPADALLHIDLSSFEVGDDGEVDSDAIAAAITNLVEKKPYLSAQGGQRFQGAADGGARNDASKPSQLTQADMDRMSPEQIVEADSKGQFDTLLGRS